MLERQHAQNVQRDIRARWTEAVRKMRFLEKQIRESSASPAEKTAMLKSLVDGIALATGDVRDWALQALERVGR